jgi:hypothetical protein
VVVVVAGSGGGGGGSGGAGLRPRIVSWSARKGKKPSMASTGEGDQTGKRRCDLRMLAEMERRE